MTDASKADELWDKIEALVDQWQATTADGHRALADQIEKARDQLDGFLSAVHTQDEAVGATARSAMTALQGIRKTLVKEEEAQARVTELEGELQEQAKALEAEKHEQEELKKLLTERSAEIQAAQRRVAELEKASEEGSAAAQAAQQQLEKLEQSQTEREASLQAANERVAALEKALGEESQERGSQQQRLTELEQGLAVKTEALESASARVMELEKTLAADADAREAAKTRISELERSLSDQQESAQGGAQRVDELQSELERAREDLEAVRARESELEESRSALNGELDQLRAAAEDAARAKGSAEAQLANVSTELERLRGELERLRESAERVAELERSLQEAEEKSLVLSERLEGETAQGTKSALAQELAKAIEANEKARREISELKLQNARMERDAVKTATGRALVKESLNVEGADRDGRPRRLGDILLEAGVLNEDQLGEALQEQKSNPTQHLGGILIKNGFASEEAVGKALACQGDFDFIVIDEEAVAPEAADLITERLASLHTCIPVQVTDDSLILAMTNPFDLVAIEDIERACERRVEPVVAKASEITAAIERCYSSQPQT